MSISDVITEFLLEHIGDNDLLELSRNELANFFSCAPSQINYVLSTRFTPDKGYAVESKRGGGGYITLIRLREDKDSVISQMGNEVYGLEGLNYSKATAMILRLVEENVMTDKEGKIARLAMSDKALSFPINIADRLRKQIFYEILIELAKGGNQIE